MIFFFLKISYNPGAFKHQKNLATSPSGEIPHSQPEMAFLFILSKGGPAIPLAV